MSTAEKIEERIKKLPEPMQAEVLDFVEFLEKKRDLKGEGKTLKRMTTSISSRFQKVWDNEKDAAYDEL
jgi:hypothetical protein